MSICGTPDPTNLFRILQGIQEIEKANFVTVIFWNK
jgi:hypothetical protein